MLTSNILRVTMVTSREVNQMTNHQTSVVRRVPIDKSNVLEFIQSKKKWTPITALNEVIETSSLFQEALREYNLSGDSA